MYVYICMYIYIYIWYICIYIYIWYIYLELIPRLYQVMKIVLIRTLGEKNSPFRSVDWHECPVRAFHKQDSFVFRSTNLDKRETRGEENFPVLETNVVRTVLQFVLRDGHSGVRREQGWISEGLRH